MGPEAAKEMRVFGLAGWFTDEYSDATKRMLDPVAARAPAALPGAVPRLHRDRAGDQRGRAGVHRAVGVGGRDHADRAGPGHPVGRRRDRARRVLPRVGRADAVRDAGRLGARRVRGADGRRRGPPPRRRRRLPVPPDAPADRPPVRGRALRLPGPDAPVLDGLDLELARGAVHGDRRRQRRRQDHARQAAHPAARAHRRPPHGRRHRPRRARRRRVAPPGQRRLPGLRPVRALGRGQHRVGAVHAPRTSRGRGARPSAPGIADAVDALPPASTPPCPAPTRAAPTCPAGSGSGSRSRGRCTRWRRGAACSCSTSRPPRSTSGRRPTSSTGSSSSRRGVTSVLISHRFSSVRRADRIVVIDAAAWSSRARTTSSSRPTGTTRGCSGCRPSGSRPGLDADGNEVELMRQTVSGQLGAVPARRGGSAPASSRCPRCSWCCSRSRCRWPPPRSPP